MSITTINRASKRRSSISSSSHSRNHYCRRNDEDRLHSRYCLRNGNRHRDSLYCLRSSNSGNSNVHRHNSSLHQLYARLNL
jgi:hypothetical protein